MSSDNALSDSSDPLGIPLAGRLAGIDFGTVRIGVAVCDSRQSLASPRETYLRRDEQADARYFLELMREESLVGWVVGLPVHLDGHESQKSAEARAFGTWLADLTKLPVRFYDERFSTHEAERLLVSAGRARRRRKQQRDMLAAQIVLEAFLESQDRGRDPPESIDG